MNEDAKVRILFEDDLLILIDCTTDIAPRFGSQATEYMVEDGSSQADHIILQPVTLTLTGMQSELEGQTGVYDPDFVGRHIELDERIQRAWASRELLYVDTRVRGVYANMVITDYSPTTSNNHGKSLHFTLTLQELTYSETRTRNIEGERIVAETSSFWAEKKQGGFTATRTPDARTAGQAQAAGTFTDAPEGVNVFRGAP